MGYRKSKLILMQKNLTSKLRLNTAQTITEIVGTEAVSFVETRGGLHCLIEPQKVVGEKHWHKQITNGLTIDQFGDLLMPVPGCCQGGFVPRFVQP